MADMMEFPKTWEEYERFFGFTDREEIYTNGARLIPSFRVKQWLDHITANDGSVVRCKDCAKRGKNCLSGRISLYDDGFCSDGERKDNEIDRR